MPKSKGIFERYIEAAERTGDIMLHYFFQKEAIRQQLLSAQEREQLIEARSAQRPNRFPLRFPRPCRVGYSDG